MQQEHTTNSATAQAVVSPPPGPFDPYAEARRLKLSQAFILRPADHVTRADNLWLIAGVLPFAGTVELCGGTYDERRQVALDMLCAVATGTPWHGRQILDDMAHPDVVYLANRGSDVLCAVLKRVCAQRGLDPARLDRCILPADIDLRCGTLDIVFRKQSRHPMLLAVDDLADGFGDGSLRNPQHIREFWHGRCNVPCILLLHDQKPDVLRGGATTVLKLERGSDGLTLHCVSDRLGTGFGPIPLGFAAGAAQ